MAPILHNVRLVVTSIREANLLIYIHTYADTYTHPSIHACIHTNIQTYIHTYINTYIHTIPPAPLLLDVLVGAPRVNL